ncbi:MAG: hypothetical protein IK089_01065, partial [Oxalobacter sp.]|nr:hypothetical protein [Oxalobacter sp.]
SVGNEIGTFSVFNTQALDPLTGDVLLKASGLQDGKDLRVRIEPQVHGNVAITNLAEGGSLDLASLHTVNTDWQGRPTGGDIFLRTDADLILSNPVIAESNQDANEVRLVSKSGSVGIATQLQVDGNVIAEAEKGQIVELPEGVIKAEEVRTFSGGTVDLQNENNAFNTFWAFGTQDGDILVKSDVKELSATIESEVNGDVELANVAEGGNLTLTHALSAFDLTVNGSERRGREGHLYLNADGNVTTDTSGMTVMSDIAIESVHGNITMGREAGHKTVSNNGLINLFTGSGNIAVHDDLKALAVNAIADASAGPVSIALNGDVAVRDDLNAQVVHDGDITIGGNVRASRSVLASVDGDGDIAFTGDVEAVNSIKAKTASGDITFIGERTAAGQIGVEAVEGNIWVNSQVASTKGNISFKTFDQDSLSDDEGNITFRSGSTLSSATGINLQTVNGDITIAGRLGGSGDSGDARVIANNDISMGSSQSGSLYINGKLESTAGSLLLKTINGSILTSGDIHAGETVSATVFNNNDANIKHQIFVDGSIEAGEDIQFGIGQA